MAEPISKLPTSSPQIPTATFYKNCVIFLLLLLITSTTIVLVQVLSLAILAAKYPLMLILPHQKEQIDIWFYQQYRTVIRITEKAFGAILVIIGEILIPNSELVLTGDHECLRDINKTILIANHQIYPDWYYLWVLARRYNRHADIKIMLIAALASIPIFGQGMTFFDFIFMKQKLHLDFQNIVNVMERQRIYGKDVPLWFFLFPEGTLNTPNNRESSHAYAEKSGIKDKPSYVILPKATGLFMCADALSDQIDYIVNLTVGYSGLEREDVPYDNYLMENVFLKQHYPKQVHIHVEKVLLKSIPGFIPDSTTEVTDYVPDQKFLKAVADPNLDKRKFQFNSWIQQVFREKDAKMKEFYDNQKFLGDAVHWNIKCEAQDILLIAILWGSAFYTVPIFWQIITTLFTSLRWAIGI